MGVILCGVDLETSGLDPTVDRIIELGAVLFDWDTKTPLLVVSALIDPAMDRGCHSEFVVSDEIQEHTGITTSMLVGFGESEVDVLYKVGPMVSRAEYMVAHFGNEFDRLFVEEACVRHGEGSWTIPWLDSSCDVKYPPHIKTRNLRHLAAEHGFLNPFPHRAVFDVLTMFKVMENYDLDAIIARSKEPIVYLQACVSFDEKEKAKERGYHWFPGAKIWWKALKQSDSEVELAECGFMTKFLDKSPE